MALLLLGLLRAQSMRSTMLSVGFEPTRANTKDLKPFPLDHSGNSTKCLTTCTHTFLLVYERVPYHM